MTTKISKIVLVLLISFFACDSKVVKEGTEIYWSKDLMTHSIKVKDGFYLDLDSVSSNKSHYFQYNRIDKKEYLSVFNKNINSIDIYKLSSPNRFKRLILPKYGPNSFGNVSGFHIVSFDSIFLFDSYSNRIILTDTSLSKSEENTIKVSDNGQLPTYLYLGNRYRPYFKNGVFIFKGITQGRGIDDKTHYKTGKNMISININNRNQESWLNFPSTYFDNAFYSLDYELQSFAVDKRENVVIQFPAIPDFAVYAKSTQKILTVKSKSLNLEEVKPESTRSNTRQMLYNPYYASIFYDEFNNYFFRIIYKSEAEENIPKSIYPHHYCRDFIVLVYNSEFDIIATKDFDRSSNLLPEMSFVSHGGLCIYQENYNEDKMTFKLLQVDER
jgi:hypothetical protein